MGSRNTLRFTFGLVLLAAALPACKKIAPSVTCYPNGPCVDTRTGDICDANGENCQSPNTVQVAGTTGAGSGTTTSPPPLYPPKPPDVPVCNCNSVMGPANDINADNDGDCLPNAVEHGSQAQVGNPNRVRSGDPNVADTDGDGIRDGCEDRNHNGILDPTEEDPTSVDTDGDGLPDNVEDANKNGIQDFTETDAANADSDRDGISDGIEDLNHDGSVKKWVDVNGNGKFDLGVDAAGESDPRNPDTDADGIADGLEDKNQNGQYDSSVGLHETIAWFGDTDGDGIIDGKEDLNHDGAFDTGETDPTNTDTDGDNLADGLEDINHNGHWDVGSETSPVLRDSDNDGIPDGLEDQNLNGKVDAFVDVNGNGCWDAGEPAGESDPRRNDTDADGISDGLEDVNHNGLCDAPSAPDPLNPNNLVRSYVETCAWLADSDCDGLNERLEDKNANGSVDVGETDPRRPDTDFDGLTDGCPRVNPGVGCEDKNNNGQPDAGETDPTLPDTDGDLLPDGCEVHFGPNPPAAGSNPLSVDSDADGYADGEEDTNHNCVYEPNLGETDPRVFNTPPASTTAQYPQWSVCSPENLNAITYAASARPTHDFRLAFEVEKTSTGACTNGACPAGLTCINNACILQSSYTVAPYGKDIDGNGFNPDDANDMLYGFIFQSPQGIVTDPTTGQLLGRDIYGFVQVSESSSSLDDVLNNVAASISTRYSAQGATISPGTVLPSRAAFDSGAGYQVVFAQRQITLKFTGSGTALGLRNDVLLQLFLGGVTPDPAGVPPTTDPVYGLISACSPGVPHCYNNFRLYVGGVQRLNQRGPTGKPVVITVVALTPDDSNPALPSAPQNRFFNDRVTRLQDLTGGASLARFAATTGKSCDHMPRNMARADMLWVVDDSRSMQAIIQKVQLAAAAAKNVLKANSGIVDVRVGMTTTNPSLAARTQCPGICSADCRDPAGSGSASACQQSCADWTLGCIKSCPSTCTGPTCNSAGSCTCNTCGLENGVHDCCPGYTVTGSPNSTPTACQSGQYGAACADPNALAGPSGLIAVDAQTHALPGGGGTFYYESSQFMDCVSVSPGIGGQKDFLNSCAVYPYSNNPLLKPFFPTPSANDSILLANAGMLHSDPNATCSTAPLTLVFDANNVNAFSCNPRDPLDPNHPCCDRLTATCTDGPTVLASQMCDLIRAMGGVPGFDGFDITSSARRHSSPEMGTRSARRLLQSMLPAYPYDASDPTSPAYDANAVKHVRRTCASTDPGCGTCYPSQPNCTIFPMATMILSDEEDFWFKDECAKDSGGNPVYAQGHADKQQLPGAGDVCNYINGDPNNPGLCTPAYCSQYFANPNVTNATGYNPDQTAMTSDGFFTLQYTSASAPECAPTNPNTTCAIDPCPSLGSQSACQTYGSQCLWNPRYTDYTGNSNHVVAGCVNRCSMYTADTSIGGASNPANVAAAQQVACQADPLCRWDQSQVRTGAQDPFSFPPGPCGPKYPPNDCQSCKRYLRKHQAFVGEPNLVGFRDMGPVYAITRTPGHPGAGTYNGQGLDACAGGQITWGRGDGQAYRDLASLTAGITQDVCEADYTQFMQQVTSDLAVLSVPYPLSGAPIPATLKVGLSRDNGNGTFSSVPVPRSSTTGFFYDATHNSIGFKSDPVDGACASGAGCSADGVIDTSEILYARSLPTVPRPGDIVYISYRVWNPVPCGGSCPTGETCAQVICHDDGSTCGACAAGDVCNLGTCCKPGELIEACVNAPACGVCQTYNYSTHTCQNTNNLCACNPGHGQTCSPNAANTCSMGFACDQTCVCEPVPGCAAGTFKTDGTVTDCAAALACCNTFAAAAATCAGNTSTRCAALAPTCVMRGNTCVYAYQTCCPSGSTAQCALDPETGARAVFCVPGACSCATTTCPAGQDCDPGNHCACFVNGG